MKDKEASSPLLPDQPATSSSLTVPCEIKLHRRSSSDKASDPAIVNNGQDSHSSKKKGSTSGGGGGLLRSFYSHSGGGSDTDVKKESETNASSGKSLLSSFTRPLLSSTPIGGGQGIFHHKRRSSTGIDQLQSSTGGRRGGGTSPLEGEKRFPRWSISHNSSDGAQFSDGPTGIFHRLRAGSKLRHEPVVKETPLSQQQEDSEPEESKSEGDVYLDSVRTDPLLTVAEDSSSIDSAPGGTSEPLEETQTVAAAACAPFGIRSSFSSSTRGRRHSFLLDDGDLQGMERSLLTLLEDFQSGRLKAFSRDGTMDKMRRVREQQERLAKLHFDLYEEQSRLGLNNPEARAVADRNLQLLTQGLQELSQSVQRLGWEEIPLTSKT